MYIGIVTCPRYGDMEIFADGLYFETEADLKEVHENSELKHHSLEVIGLKKAPKLEDIPIHYALLVWDEQGKSQGQLYVNVPKEGRDAAMKEAKKKYPNRDLTWHKEYSIANIGVGKLMYRV